MSRQIDWPFRSRKSDGGVYSTERPKLSDDLKNLGALSDRQIYNLREDDYIWALNVNNGKKVTSSEFRKLVAGADRDTSGHRWKVYESTLVVTVEHMKDRIIVQRVLLVVIAGLAWFLWLNSLSYRHKVDSMYDRTREIKLEAESLIVRVNEFSDGVTDWKEVVPGVKEQAISVRKKLQGLEDDLSGVSLEPDDLVGVDDDPR
jgi:hypothetical protein